MPIKKKEKKAPVYGYQLIDSQVENDPSGGQQMVAHYQILVNGRVADERREGFPYGTSAAEIKLGIEKVVRTYAEELKVAAESAASEEMTDEVNQLKDELQGQKQSVAI